jgi:UDP-glucuronate 4-epimerase
MDVLCHRFFTVYGPRQRPDMAISQFVRKVRRGEPVDLYGDGTSRRDYTYVDDIVTGLVSSIDKAPGLGYQIFNLGNSHTVQLRELIESVGQAVGRRPHVRHRPEQAGDVKVTYACNEKAQKLLGYVPKTSIQEGLCRYVAWLEEEEGAYAAA